MNQTKLQEYWNRYKDYFKQPESQHQEKYKWKVLKQVFDRWNWDADNKPEMFKNAFEVQGSKNLWMSGNFYPVPHTNWMFEEFKQDTLHAFENLFNEEIPITERVNTFIQLYDDKIPELQAKLPDKKVQYHSHGDSRAISLYLYIQNPNKYFLFKYTMVKNFCEQVDIPKIKAGDKSNIEKYNEMANEILDFIKKDSQFISEYREFTDKPENFNDESLHLLVQDFVYSIANHFNDNLRYWRIGSNDGETSYYSEMLNDNYVAIGWSEIGDLEVQEIESKKSIQQLLLNKGFKFKSKNVLSRKAGEIFDFYSNTSNEDIVALMDGNKVLAIGKIKSDYVYDNTKPFSHYREVEWLKKDIRNFNISDGTNTTFYPLSKRQTISKIEAELKKETSTTNTNEMTKVLINHPLNQILYGPPGTGKTFKTKAIAVEIIDGSIPETRLKLNKRYFELIESGQILFTTFHQSMSYEDFVEGIKPKMNGDEESEISYEVQDGIFKDLCKRANKKTTVSNEVQSNIEPFDIAWDKLIEKVKGKLSNDELLKIGSWEYGLSSKESLKYESLNSPSKYTFTITKKNIYDTYQGKLARPSGAFQKDMKDILKFMKSEFNLKDFEETSLDNEREPNQKYVLIIDEINRGNVSAIFGELITLIENDKRAGQDEALEVTLPYSKEKFSVPKNIHIIGTMNTADRSVEALDTALRRRFSFSEVSPRTDILKRIHVNQGRIGENEDEIDLTKLLDKINDRIEILLDKDHKIGHSYFIKVEDFIDLIETFKDKVIPLLEEYFYGDFGKIGLVLGRAFIDITKKENKTNFADFDHDDKEIFKEKNLYHFTQPENWTPKSFQSIYDTSFKIDE